MIRRDRGDREGLVADRRADGGRLLAVVQSQVLTYVAPVPGGDGRRALLFQYTVLSVDDENAAELAKGLVFVGEAIMSTLRWTAAA